MSLVRVQSEEPNFKSPLRETRAGFLLFISPTSADRRQVEQDGKVVLDANRAGAQGFYI
ncbi:hypothetical protein ACQV2Y_06580 [Pantoea allii]